MEIFVCVQRTKDEGGIGRRRKINAIRDNYWETEIVHVPLSFAISRCVIKRGNVQ